eukprot:TRINITY_DN2451_c0_g1_i1.p1 TRINITY_DN2451_c0_g1~~TRINITY_DN2451_c0_g1_i1.p1  ORF type:complete len:163 (+),score=19.77 TRINITY_DN2451_c0_g1_i1:355-843(+)
MTLFKENFSGPSEYGEREVLTQFARGLYRAFVLYRSDVDGLVAFAMTLQLTSTASHLEYLAVSSKAQGKGLGSLVLRELKRELQKGTDKVLTLECEKKLIPFYQKLGAIDVGVKPKEWKISKGGVDQVIAHHFLVLPIDEQHFVTPQAASCLQRRSIQLSLT